MTKMNLSVECVFLSVCLALAHSIVVVGVGLVVWSPAGAGAAAEDEIIN